MIDPKRICDEFDRLAAFDSESFAEADIKEYLRRRLTNLGLRVEEDDAWRSLGRENPKSAGNLYAFGKGSRKGEPILFCAHMDTVSPGKGKRPIWHSDGRVTSDGRTVLGADDLSGIVAILEALTALSEDGMDHPDLEVIFSVAEQPFCKGISCFDFSKVRSKTAYVLDLEGPVGRAAVRAPTLLTLDVRIDGRAAHSGFSPEKGINALSAVAAALSRTNVGRVDPETTVNFGLIEGGTGRNVVPASVSVQGEIRSLLHERATERADKIREIFREEAEKRGASLHFSVEEALHAYRVPPDAPVCRHFARALHSLGWKSPDFVTTLGGSDANVLNQHGISSIVVANAMENIHTTAEFSRLDELIRIAQLTLRLMTLERE